MKSLLPLLAGLPLSIAVAEWLFAREEPEVRRVLKDACRSACAIKDTATRSQAFLQIAEAWAQAGDNKAAAEGMAEAVRTATCIQDEMGRVIWNEKWK